MARISRLVPPRACALVTACQKLAKDALPPVLKCFVDRVDDAFFELANKADSSQRQQIYFDAMRELRLKRPQLERDFFQTIDTQIEHALDAPLRKRPGTATDLQSELSLVDIDDVEADLAVTNLIENLQTRARQELFALDQRMGHLLSDPDPSADANPFGPHALGKALRALADGLDVSVEVKITLLKLFDRHAGAGVVEMWRAMNELLVQAGVLPSLQAKQPRAGAAPRTRVIIETENGSAEAGCNDVFGTLQRLMQQGPAALHSALGIGLPGTAGVGGAFGGVPGTSAGMAGGHGAGWPGVAGPPGASGGVGDGGGAVGGPATLAPGGFPGLDERLAGMQGTAVGGTIAIPTTALVSHLTQLQLGGRVGGECTALAQVDPSLVAAGSINVIRAMREHGVAAGISDTDTLTLDIVALLFDYILKDASIADAIKALIGRLQIPYLKVALLDKDLFSKKSHPARRLLDAMAEAAVGLGDSTLAHDALYTKIAAVVARVIAEFDSNLELFEELRADFEAFLQDDLASTQRRTELSTRSLRTREKVVMAKMAVDEAVRQRLYGVDTREFVQQFVQDYWRQMLIVTHVEAGPESDTWRAQLEVIDELVWSVQPKATPEEKKDLTSRLPKLLKALRAGMHELEMEPAVCSKFLTMLASVHVVSVKQVEEASLAERKLVRREQPQEAALATGHSEEEFVKQALQRLFARKSIEAEELDIDLSAFEAAPAIDAVDAGQVDDEAHVEEVMQLDLGDWLDLTTSDGSCVRSRFTYISPATGRYLFTDRQGNKAFDLDFDELVAFFRRGGAARVETRPDPLFDRAIGELMGRVERVA
ncbi:MAG: DUF1631 domain-containing protein [Gammaproteobacteria bacterium]|nr:DUF1631 domain-containing protein [Gammaproteobacteria bacterium]